MSTTGQEEFQSGAIRPVECFREAWDIIKDEYWLIFAIVIVGILIAGASMYILIGPMFCGIYIALLRKIDGERADFNQLWKGFEFFVPSIPVVLAIVVPLIIWFVVLMFTLYIPIIAAAMAGRGSEGLVIGSFAAVIVVDVIIAIVMTAVHSMLLFAFPLIVDRRLSGFEAIKLSARATLNNASGIAGLIGLSFVAALAGYAAFCVGIYFVVPLMMAAYVVAYRKVFPRLDDRRFEPPPIGAYGGG